MAWGRGVVGGSIAVIFASDHSKRPMDLKLWPSEAKYLEESDFDVEKSLAPQKIAENYENRKKIRKFFIISFFRRQKIKNYKSSETRFAEVSRRFEPCSRKRTFEVRGRLGGIHEA